MINKIHCLDCLYCIYDGEETYRIKDYDFDFKKQMYICEKGVRSRFRDWSASALRNCETFESNLPPPNYNLTIDDFKKERYSVFIYEILNKEKYDEYFNNKKRTKIIFDTAIENKIGLANAVRYLTIKTGKLFKNNTVQHSVYLQKNKIIKRIKNPVSQDKDPEKEQEKTLKKLRNEIRQKLMKLSFDDLNQVKKGISQLASEGEKHE